MYRWKPLRTPSNEVLLDGHDGDLVSLATGVGQDPVDHGLLVGPIGEPHTPPQVGLNPWEVTPTMTSVSS